MKKRWDYEELGREKTIDFWVIISNVRAEKWKSAVPYTDNQRVIIRVKDVNDEPPYFINRPLPMQAVVKLNAAPNSPVFTLQAKDPDTDHNLHYFLVRLVKFISTDLTVRKYQLLKSINLFVGRCVFPFPFSDKIPIIFPD